MQVYPTGQLGVDVPVSAMAWAVEDAVEASTIEFKAVLVRIPTYPVDGIPLAVWKHSTAFKVKIPKYPVEA